VIVLDLECANTHRFEAWFASADAFDAQLASGQLSCPHCASHEIRRLLSAPHVHTASHAAPPPAGLLDELRAAARRAEDVGTRFPEEARRIHYGETDARAIRGQAGADDIRELREEGIAVLPLPPDKDTRH
jgi:hypothetical protein